MINTDLSTHNISLISVKNGNIDDQTKADEIVINSSTSIVSNLQAKIWHSLGFFVFKQILEIIFFKICEFIIWPKLLGLFQKLVQNQSFHQCHFLHKSVCSYFQGCI